MSHSMMLSSAGPALSAFVVPNPCCPGQVGQVAKLPSWHLNATAAGQPLEVCSASHAWLLFFMLLLLLLLLLLLGHC